MSGRETDEVVALGIRLGAAMRREEDLISRAREARRSRETSAEIYLDSATKHVTDETYVLRDMLSFVRAKTLTGAAIQLVEALNLVDRVWDQFPEDKQTPQLERHVRAIGRLLYSALGIVEDLADQKVGDIVASEFVSRYLDPWISVEDRCKQLKPEVAS